MYDCVWHTLCEVSGWSVEGVTTDVRETEEDVGNGNVTCTATHLTGFAVLVDPTGVRSASGPPHGYGLYMLGFH